MDNEEPSSTTETRNECPICLDQLDYNVKALECAHSFHHGCIDQWLQRKQTCPLCRLPTKVGPRSLTITNRRRSRRIRAYQHQTRQIRVQRLQSIRRSERPEPERREPTNE
ncbi:uncharacterized protein LOC134223694 [Armigeres subalbatus]|uniref:uncharacterized protein LOC134223694 n=1 Tax=Armigeres subalbatus TaxID=124917 RepID=UPI002ED338D0